MADQKKNEYAGMLTEQLFWKATGERALSGAYLLFGEEELTKRLSVDRVIDLLDPAGKDLNYQVVRPADKKELFHMCTQLPFFDSLRVLRFREWDKGQAESMTEDDTLLRVDPATVLLIEMRGAGKTDPFYKWFLKNAKERMVPFLPFNEDRAMRFLDREAALAGVKADRNALKKMVTLCGTDGFRLKNEFSKARDLVGPGGTVTEEVIDKVVSPTLEAEAFEILDLFMEGKKKQGLMLLEKYLRADPRSVPFSYAGVFLSRLKPMLKARLLLDEGKKSAEVTAKLGGGYYYQKIVAQAQKFTASQLRNAINAFSQVDTNTKRGIAAADETLELAIHKSF